MFLFRLLIVELGICDLSFMFQLGDLLKGLVCLRLSVMAVMTGCGFRKDFRTVSRFNCGVVLLNLMDFAVNTGGECITNLADGLIRLKSELALSLRLL